MSLEIEDRWFSDPLDNSILPDAFRRLYFPEDADWQVTKAPPSRAKIRAYVIAEIRVAKDDGRFLSLDDRERQILEERFSNHPTTLRTLGKELGVSHEQVRLIQNKALAKLIAAR